MDGFLKQNTASQTRWIGPFIDDGDFITAATGLTIANTDIKVSANGGSSANKNSGGGTHDVNGMYAVTWNATDTATVGELKYSVKVAGALQVFGSYVVLEEAIYDAMFAASANAWSGAAGSTTVTALASGSITAAVIATGAIDADAIADNAIDAGAFAADAITAAKVASDVGTEIGTAVWATTTRVLTAGTNLGTVDANVTQISGDSTAADNVERWFDGTVGFSTVGADLTASFNGSLSGDVGGNVAGDIGGSVQSVTDAVTVGLISNNVITAASIAADANTEIGTAVWATTTRQLTSAQTFSLTGDITGNLSGSVGSVTGAVGSVTGNVGGNVTGSVGSVATGGITAASIADGAIDRATLAADTGLQTIRSNTAQAGANTTITLDASASAVNDFYNDSIIYITGGTGAGQARTITDYVGSTKVATVATWGTNPSSDSTFAILPAGAVSASVSSADKAEIVDLVWDEATSGHATAGTTGKALTDAGSAGDPWSTALPGAYAAGTAGAIIGTTIPGLLQDAEVTVTSPLSEDGQELTIRCGDDYLQAIGTQIAFSWSGLAYSLSGATLTFRSHATGEVTMTVSSATAAYLERTNAQTAALIPGIYAFEVDGTLSGGQKVSLTTGELTITAQLPT